MIPSANADQADFWNARPGQNWVTYAADLDLMHSAVLDLLFDRGGPEPGESVLDLGCGAGTSTFAAAEAVGPSGTVEGLDISEPLLARARERKEEKAASNVTFTLADAQEHGFSPAAYDRVISRFGVMFFSDPVAAFDNIAGSMRPGAAMVFAAWTGPEHNPWFTIPQKAAVERLGPVAATAPEAPGPMAFRDPGRVIDILESVGLMDCACEQISVDLHHPGGLDAVMGFIPHIGPIARTLREKNGSQEDLDAILEIIRVEIARFQSADGIRVPAEINMYSARAA